MEERAGRVDKHLLGAQADCSVRHPAARREGRGALEEDILADGDTVEGGGGQDLADDLGLLISFVRAAMMKRQAAGRRVYAMNPYRPAATHLCVRGRCKPVHGLLGDVAYLPAQLLDLLHGLRSVSVSYAQSKVLDSP
jgi:hypothetical protein